MSEAKTRVDFHEVAARLQPAVCAQVAALFEEGERVYVWAPSKADAAALDEQLWTFSDDSFIPHGLWSGEGECAEQIAVGWVGQNPNSASVVVIAGAISHEELLTAVGKFSRLVDLVPKRDERAVAAARVRYKILKDSGLNPHFHKLI
jgi:DNA polymerase-3 subunit chi